MVSRCVRPEMPGNLLRNMERLYAVPWAASHLSFSCLKITSQWNITSDSPWRSPRSARCSSPPQRVPAPPGSQWARTAPRAAWSDCRWTPSASGPSDAKPRPDGNHGNLPTAEHLVKKNKTKLVRVSQVKHRRNAQRRWIRLQFLFNFEL